MHLHFILKLHQIILKNKKNDEHTVKREWTRSVHSLGKTESRGLASDLGKWKNLKLMIMQWVPVCKEPFGKSGFRRRRSMWGPGLKMGRTEWSVQEEIRLPQGSSFSLRNHTSPLHRLHLWSTGCYLADDSPPGSSVHEIFQARILEVQAKFLNTWALNQRLYSEKKSAYYVAKPSAPLHSTQEGCALVCSHR